MNEAKYKECEELGFHEYGYNEESGICTHCGLLHDCRVEFDFEFKDDHFECNLCHSIATQDIVEEILEVNAEERLLKLERMYQ